MNNLVSAFADALLPAPDLALAFAAVFFATTLKAFAGFGFGLAVVPLLSLVLHPAEAVPMALMLDLIGSSQLVPRARKQADWRSLKLLVPAAFLTIPFGIYALHVVPADGLKLGIALILLSTVALMATGARLPEHLPKPAVLGVGGLAGLLSGGAAMPGPPVMVYFLARPTQAAVNRASLLMFFFFTDIGSIAAGYATGIVIAKTLLLSVLLSPALLLGNIAGHWAFGRTHETLYRRIALGLLAIIAVVMLTDALRS
ncbi:MAG: hypothetical protein AMXMBFR74_15040 [Parvibaculum sp.]|uniref:sulfite exporter TauE/SafE family protein n=1 Tax=Parvibaculum sp. TaxID=2024848 RepID=UPI0035B8BCD8